MSNKFDAFVEYQLSQPPKLKMTPDSWNEHLYSLYDTIEGYLKKYINSKEVVITYDTKNKIEEITGEYVVTSMKITIGSNICRIEPRSIESVWGNDIGSVDLKGCNGMIRLMLVDNMNTLTWQFKSKPPNIHYLQLSEDSFNDALVDIL